MARFTGSRVAVQSKAFCFTSDNPAARSGAGKKGVEALKYLRRYIFRTAISNRRIIKYENDRVTFEYRNSKTKLLDRIALLLRWKRPDPHLEKPKSNPCPKCGHKMMSRQ